MSIALELVCELGQIGAFKEVTGNRGWGNETLDNVAVKNRVYGLIELDVTKTHARSIDSRNA